MILPSQPHVKFFFFDATELSLTFKDGQVWILRRLSKWFDNAILQADYRFNKSPVMVWNGMRHDQMTSQLPVYGILIWVGYQDRFQWRIATITLVNLGPGVIVQDGYAPAHLACHMTMFSEYHLVPQKAQVTFNVT